MIQSNAPFFILLYSASVSVLLSAPYIFSFFCDEKERKKQLSDDESMEITGAMDSSQKISASKKVLKRLRRIGSFIGKVENLLPLHEHDGGKRDLSYYV